MSLHALGAAGGPVTVKKWGMIEGTIWVNLWLLLTHAHMYCSHTGESTHAHLRRQKIFIWREMYWGLNLQPHTWRSQCRAGEIVLPQGTVSYCLPSVRDRGIWI